MKTQCLNYSIQQACARQAKTHAWTLWLHFWCGHAAADPLCTIHTLVSSHSHTQSTLTLRFRIESLQVSVTPSPPSLSILHKLPAPGALCNTSLCLHKSVTMRNISFVERKCTFLMGKCLLWVRSVRNVQVSFNICSIKLFFLISTCFLAPKLNASLQSDSYFMWL